MGKGNKLFGLRIAKIVYNGIKSAGNVLPLTLVKVTPGTRNPAALLSGTNPTSVNHKGRGFTDDPDLLRYGHGNTPAFDIINKRETKIYILGASLPEGVKPGPQDRVIFLGHTWSLTKVKADPAEAVFTCVALGAA